MGKNCRSASMAQVSSEINQLTAQKGLLFQEAFDGKGLSERIQKYYKNYRDRIFGPSTTLFAFLSQVTSSDRSCTETVARVNVDRIAQGLEPASPDNGAYVKARERIPEQFLKELTTTTAEVIEQNIPEEWLWKGRDVKFADGSTLTMADTSPNQAEYGQMSSQKDGIGFPITRIMAIFSLASGCILDFANASYKGKGTGEHGLLRQLMHCFKAGDILVGDAYFPAYFLLAALQLAGVDALFASDGKRAMDFRSGERLGKKDHIIFWQKPQRPNWMTPEVYETMPEFIEIRECIVSIERPGFRSKTLTLVTSLLDSQYASKEELGWLYGQRWAAELNLKALKTTLKMEHIPAKTPAMVRKQIWATLLAYNLIRKIIGQAAYQYGLLPSEISFKGAVQHLNAFRPLWTNFTLSDCIDIIQILLNLISKLKIGNRPGRIEPRAIKKRPRPFPRLKIPRIIARKKIMQNHMR